VANRAHDVAQTGVLLPRPSRFTIRSGRWTPLWTLHATRKAGLFDQCSCGGCRRTSNRTSQRRPGGAAKTLPASDGAAAVSESGEVIPLVPRKETDFTAEREEYGEGKRLHAERGRVRKRDIAKPQAAGRHSRAGRIPLFPPSAFRLPPSAFSPHLPPLRYPGARLKILWRRVATADRPALLGART